MTPQLIFSTDLEIDDTRANLVEAALRRQLTGLRLDQDAQGTFFEVHGSGLPKAGIRVQLVSVPDSGAPIGRDTAFVVKHAAPAGNDLATTQTQQLDVPEILLQFASTVTVAHPSDETAAAIAHDRFNDLVGVPKDDVLDEVTSRLKGVRWLADWSHRHYGRVIPAAVDANRSASLLLLLGDPGTGKSVLAHQLPTLVAGRLRHPVIFVQLSHRLRGSGIHGRTATDLVSAVDAIGHLAAQTRMPAMAFLDEAESVAGTRGTADGSSGAQENVAMVDALITGIDRVFSQTNARLAFLMASNLSDRIDPAVRRRATVFEFTRPSDDDRRLLLERALGEVFDRRTLDRINHLLVRPDLPLTAADVLNQVITRAVRESARYDRLIEVERVCALAVQARATRPVDTR